MEFSEQLKELRKKAGLTQEQLAEKAGLTRDGIAHLEQGRREPSLATAIALADALGVEVSQFAPKKAASAKKARRPRKK